MEACHNIGITALLENIAKNGTQSTMKSGRKTLQKLSPDFPQKCRKGTSVDQKKKVQAEIRVITQ
jgi:hypothetical protein